MRKNTKENNRIKRKTVIQSTIKNAYMPVPVPVLSQDHWSSDSDCHMNNSFCDVLCTDNTSYAILDFSSDDSQKGLSVGSDQPSPESDIVLFEPKDSEPELSLVPVCRPITDYRNNLTEMEGKYLTELQTATNILRTPIGTITSEATTFGDAVHVLFSARRLDIEKFVSMAKNLVAFKDIKEHDRLLIIKPGIIEMFHMRNVTSFFDDGQAQYLILPTVRMLLTMCQFDSVRGASSLRELLSPTGQPEVEHMFGSVRSVQAD